jgi:putative lipoprotein
MLGRIVELVFFGVAPMVFAALVLPGHSMAEEKVISGEVLYRERIALPPNAVVTVQLSDVSLADAPSKTIAEQIIEKPGQVPVKFRLGFDPSVIKPKMTYALQARITVDDKLWFINDTRHEIDPLQAQPATLMLIKAAQSAQPAPERIFDTWWLAEDIGGRGVIDTAQSTLRIGADGRVNGRGACNSYFGTAKVDGSSVSFGDIGATMMACAPALMDQEHKLFEALKKTSSVRLEQGKLFLVDADGRDVIRFARKG